MGGRCLESTYGSGATRDKVPLTTRDRGRFQETTPMRPDSSTWKREQAVRSRQETCLEHSMGGAVMVEGSSLLQSCLRPPLRA